LALISQAYLIVPRSARRGPDLNESDHKLSQTAEDCFAFDSRRSLKRSERLAI